MKEVKGQGTLELGDVKQPPTAVEIRDAHKLDPNIPDAVAAVIHEYFENRRYPTKIWQLEAVKLFELIVAKNCSEEILNAARGLLLLRNRISGWSGRAPSIHNPESRFFCLSTADKATVLWFTTASGDYYSKMLRESETPEETKRLIAAEKSGHKRLYKFLEWCSNQKIVLSYKNKNGIQEALGKFATRSMEAARKKSKWLVEVVESLKMVGFVVSDAVRLLMERIGLCEGFSPEITKAVEDFLSKKSDRNKPLRFRVEGFGNVPAQGKVDFWKKSTCSGARQIIFGLYGHCAAERKVSRDQLSLWAPTKADIESVPRRHTEKWWQPLPSWFAYLNNRPGIPKGYKKEILKILKNPPALVESEQGKRPVFLTPLEIVLVEKLLEKLPADGHVMKIKIMFLLGCLAGLRPFEITQVTLNMFNRDPQTGFLRLDEKGRGVLHLPARNSKGEYSPSHPEFGIIIVPYLAKVINDYLGTDAMSGAVEAANRGKDSKDVYLVHKGRHWSKGRLDEGYVTEYYQKYKHILSKALVHHPAGVTFSAHDMRHSCNDLILSLAVLWRSNVRIAEIHERHDIHRRGSSVNIRHYSRDVSKSAYYDAVTYALSFPWEETSVKEWMKEKGYNEHGELPDEMPLSILESLLGPGRVSNLRYAAPAPTPVSAGGNGGTGALKELNETIKGFEDFEKRRQRDAKSGLVRECDSLNDIRIAADQAGAKIKRLQDLSADDVFKFACEQALKTLSR